MSTFNISPEQMEKNFKEYKRRITEYFPNRSKNLLKMCDEMEERFVLDPASSFEYFHNAIPGGYLDHVLRVDDFAVKHYELWKDSGLNCNFTLEELHFGALHHDLGKLGLPGDGNGHYLINTSKWHIENQGKMYYTNPHAPKMTTSDRSFFLLNYFQVPYTLNEMIGIRTTDGMYDEGNKEYLSGFGLETKLRNPLPYILHHADMMAFRFEFERWNKFENKFKHDIYLGKNDQPNQPVEVIETKIKTGKSNISIEQFDDLFKV